MSSVKPIPDDDPRITPYLHVDRAAEAIDYYREVFGAEERMRMARPDGRVGHAELSIGDSVVMVSDEHPEMGVLSPKAVGGTPVTLSIYVEDVDETFARALGSGAIELRAVQDQFYGDRSGQLEDPFGHRWSVHTHIEDVSPEEMESRASRAAAAP